MRQDNFRPPRGARNAAERPPRRGRTGRRRRAGGVFLTAGLLSVALLASGLGGPVSAPVGPAARPLPPCPTDPDAAADLHCIELLPAAGVPDVDAHVELLPAPSPFGIAVSPTGAVRRRVVLHAGRLPRPSSLGPYRALVAWATTPRLRPMLRLGTVTEGRNDLGTLALNRFLILVTAEPRADAEERGGRLVLRGTSPSLRLHPHDYAAFLGTAAAGRSAGDAEAGAAGDGDAWPGPPPVPPDIQPMPGLAGLRPDVAPFLPDADPASVPEVLPSRTVELSDGDTLRLEARPVRVRVGEADFVGYGYNGRIPGPLIRVRQAAEITVLFRNGLEMPTTVHWHGLRLENAFDGVPGVTQEPVPPGGSFAYRVRFPDAGLYWYHPHVREDAQQDLGLYGNIRVRSGEDGWLAPVNREEVLVLDDLLLKGGAPVPWGRTAATHAMMGRFGNTSLVNGRDRWRLRVRPGEVVRFFLTNVANTRVFHLVFEGAETKAVATDLGRFPREERVDGVVLAPAERYVVEARYGEPGTYPLTHRVQGVDHVRGAFYSDVDTLGVVEVVGPRVTGAADRAAAFRRLRRLASLEAELRALRPWRDRPPDRRLLLTVEARDLPFPLRPMMQADSLWFAPVEWTGSMAMSNWITTTRRVRWILRDLDTGRENMDIGWRFRLGDTIKIKLVNDRDAFHAMQHPIHLHGQRFLTLRRDGVPRENPAWKDTVLVPAGSTAELLVELTNPGRWMLHCHISEHLESGMRTVLDVVPPDSADRPDPGSGPARAGAPDPPSLRELEPTPEGERR